MLTPVLSAMMCDGIGGFDDLDYKRALLVFDRVHYLLPEHTVRFRDVTGRRRALLYPLDLQHRVEFTVHHYSPPETMVPVLTAAATRDINDAAYAGTLGTIPPEAQLYAWRVVNSDQELGGGESPGLSPDQFALAHALLFNKFLLAADMADCVPIAGREYVTQMIRHKHRLATGAGDALDRVSGLGLGASDGAKYHELVRCVVARLVPDEVLERMSFEEIVAFRTANRDLFERFSQLMRKLSNDLRGLPASPQFKRELDQLLATTVWQANRELEEALRVRWSGPLEDLLRKGAKADATRTAIAHGVTGLAVGVLPAISLGTLSVATVAGGVAAATPWLVNTALEFLHQSSAARKNGLYYLQRLTSAGE